MSLTVYIYLRDQPRPVDHQQPRQPVHHQLPSLRRRLVQRQLARLEQLPRGGVELWRVGADLLDRKLPAGRPAGEVLAVELELFACRGGGGGGGGAFVAVFVERRRGHVDPRQRTVRDTHGQRPQPHERLPALPPP